MFFRSKFGRNRRLQRMQGEGEMETAEPAGTTDLRIPDSLRCRRSDGRKWRCFQPVMPGLRFCEHHRMRCNRNYNQSTKFKITKPVKSSHLTSDPQRFTKQQRPCRRTEGEQIEEAQETVRLPTTGLSFCNNDRLRCREDTDPITSARSGVVPPGLPADSNDVRTVDPSTLEEVMETLRRSQEQMETMRRSQEQGRLQLDKILKDNNRLWDKIHHLEKNNKHYKEKISSLFSELIALKQRPPSSPLLSTAPLAGSQQKWQESGASSTDPRMEKEIGQIHSMIAQINSHMAHSSIILSQVTDAVAHLGRDREN